MPVGTIGARARAKRLPPRRNPVGVPQPTAGITIVSASAAGSVATIGFNQVVILCGTPNYTTDLEGVTAVSAVQTNPTTIAITFSGAITSATAINIPYEDPAVRNTSGGFVSTSTFPV
jgi:hypothetical protein